MGANDKKTTRRATVAQMPGHSGKKHNKIFLQVELDIETDTRLKRKSRFLNSLPFSLQLFALAVASTGINFQLVKDLSM